MPTYRNSSAGHQMMPAPRGAPTQPQRACPNLAFLGALALVCCLVLGGCASQQSGVGARATPTVTPATTEGRLAGLARQALGTAAHDVVAAYDAQGQTLELTATLNGGVPRTASDISASQERVKLLSFRTQRAEWTSGIPLRSVTITLLGPTLDDYADLVTGPYGAAVLTAATATTFAWSSLSADSAWNRYDRVWLAERYAPNQQYGAPPAATATPTR